MKKNILFLLVFLSAPALLRGQIVAPNATLQSLCDKYLADREGEYVPVVPDTLFDKSFTSIVFPNHQDKITTSVSFPKKYKPFNLKKDNISNISIKSFKLQNGATGYELFVLHQNGEPCDMNEFNVRIDAENIECETVGSYSTFKILGNSIDYADGTYSMDGKITIKHRASGQTVDIPFSLSWYDKVTFYSGIAAYLVDDLHSNVFKQSYLVANMGSRNMWMLKAPIVIDVSGLNGADGKNGANGLNGHGAFTTPILKVHVPATAGQVGGNGQNGGNGGNGGHVLVCYNVSDNNTITAKFGGGNAGKGGKGGVGGKHGPGCGLYGKAPDGSDGVDGIPGKVGSGFLYKVSQQDIIKNSHPVIITCFPSIWVDMTTRLVAKKDKKDSKKESRKDKKKDLKKGQPSSGSVDF